VTAALAFIALGAGSAVAQNSEPPPTASSSRALIAAAVRRAGDIAIDGRLDEAEWGRAQALSGFIASDPVEGVPAEHDTEVFVLYDADAIYIGARMYDPDPESIFRQLTRRDQLGEFADYFGISLDTNLDRRTAYTFQVSAAGVQGDEYRYDDTSRDGSWDAVWESAVGVDPEGWTAELRIPLSQLRFAFSSSPQAWGLNAARRRNASAEQTYWALESRVQQGGVSVFGELAGLDLPSGVRSLEVRPYALMKRHAALAEPGNPFFDGSDHGFNGGVDIRYGLGSTFVLDATFNPDFGQVEVDPAVINLTALETTYPERRPFFTQDEQLFNVRNMFYSRRIGRAPQGRAPSGAAFVDTPEETTILGAGKLTGRTANGLTIGALAAVAGTETGTAFPWRTRATSRRMARGTCFRISNGVMRGARFRTAPPFPVKAGGRAFSPDGGTSMWMARGRPGSPSRTATSISGACGGARFSAGNTGQVRPCTWFGSRTARAARTSAISPSAAMPRPCSMLSQKALSC